MSQQPRPTLRQRVAAAILDAAAEVLAAQGGQASMSDVAAAAGVARATLYRYFPSRDALLDELARVAAREAGEGLAAARLDRVPPGDGVVRAVRVLVGVGDYFVVLDRARRRAGAGAYERKVAAPLRAVIERGQTAGERRDGVPAAWLAEALVGLVVSVLRAAPRLGVEDRVAAIGAVFLEGVRARESSGIVSAPVG